MTAAAAWPLIGPEAVRTALRERREIALIDVREEEPYAQAHPLFAVQMALGRIELDAPWRLPRRDVLIALMDAGEGLAELAACRLQALGYSQIHLLEGGLSGWQASGGELFRDVNVPSKAFGELVEHERQTPSLPAPALQALLESGADLVVLDARRYDEYQTMSIPGGTSVPGAELLLRARDLAPDPATQVVVNCAGRTRSIIGAQSLINAGLPNPVLALRNGTIGWTLAGQTLAHGQSRRFEGSPDPAHLQAARSSAWALAERAGAQRLDRAGLAAWEADSGRSLYRWDVRGPGEYAAGHLPGFGSAPGGQLVQETDVFAAVRGARIVLADGGPATDGVRAAMTAHWLAQMGWAVGWLSDTDAGTGGETGPWQPPGSPLPPAWLITPAELAASHDRSLLLDFSSSAAYVKAHIPGAAWLLRSDLQRALEAAHLPSTERIVATCTHGDVARFAAAELTRLSGLPVTVLDGGNRAWAEAGHALEYGAARLLSPRIDRYRRPYEGTDAPRAAMQAYLDWEYGLVAQLARDGSHRFEVLPAS
ncbi:rhodanese homology domain-containing protein [soil metagenome]